MITVSANYYAYVLRIIQDMVSQHGEDLDKPPHLVALPPLKITDRISHHHFFNLFESVQNFLNDPHLGLHIGADFRIGSYRAESNFLSFCQNIEQAGYLTCRYSALAHTMGTPYLLRSFEGDKDEGRFLWEPNFNTADEPMSRHITEYIITNYVMSLNWLAWNFGKGVKRVTFKHEAQADEAEYRKTFDCEVVFGASQNTVVLHDGILRRPLLTADDLKLSTLKANLERKLAAYNGEDDLLLRVEQKMREVIQYEKPTLPKIASELALSERTFKRYLQGRNIKFSETLTSIQKDICNMLIQDGRSYSEIAHLLWYADQSAFTRAFKKWYGKSPSKMQS